ncbi:hypothetical protein E4T56_gene5065 [Termitomyces sp. T112]|nr:hypothetical protein C0989_003147 [Termitomyces sp. Mn162]KAG5719889.1 hypothetical protein E4T56_gene5065 [Termitomyces sp. T112]KAH0587082.1 hypothetical protein H2248_005900 [Termitomyces sp. 'cryptogamus']KNZ73665.1 hypothetical protein J132_10466 [Termitomyces sp. J132]
MSISIDDLANSLSASHVGQEALDLAALQAQLAKTLFASSAAHSSNPQRVSRKTSFSQPCNTPTFTNFTQLVDSQATAAGPSWAADDMEEDEPMVEDLLLPRSPNSSMLQFSLPLTSRPTTHLSSNNQTSSESPSSFASTDPFYLAQLQAQRQNPSPYSPFTELGKISQHSPFSAASSHRDRDHFGTNASTAPLSLETHSFLVSASSAFD